MPFSAVWHCTGDIAAEDGQAWTKGCSETFEAPGSRKWGAAARNYLLSTAEQEKVGLTLEKSLQGCNSRCISWTLYSEIIWKYIISGNFITFK